MRIPLWHSRSRSILHSRSRTDAQLTDEWLKMKRKRVISESQRKSGARVSDPNSEVEISFRRLDDLERRLQALGASSRQIREIYRSIDERENRRRSTELLLRKAIVALERDSYTLGRLERGLSETLTPTTK